MEEFQLDPYEDEKEIVDLTEELEQISENWIIFFLKNYGIFKLAIKYAT